VTSALRIRPEAEEELLAAAQWYEERKPDSIDVAAIAHAKRRPGYWQTR
jgi:hypothetical protein